MTIWTCRMVSSLIITLSSSTARSVFHFIRRPYFIFHKTTVLSMSRGAKLYAVRRTSIVSMMVLARRRKTSGGAENANRYLWALVDGYNEHPRAYYICAHVLHDGQNISSVLANILCAKE